MRPSFHCAKDWPPSAAYLKASTEDFESPARISSTPMRKACWALLNSFKGIFSMDDGCDPSKAQAPPGATSAKAKTAGAKRLIQASRSAPAQGCKPPQP